tara:strand:+ start:673 stop:999 length:327 start_codon:yes stop_codon:yes gene_type:complete
MGQLANYTIDQVAGALALTLGSIGGLCLILFKSRCQRISICWGVWSCDRKVVEEDSEEDKTKEEIIPTNIRPLKETDSIGRPLPEPPAKQVASLQPEPEPEPQSAPQP